MLTAVAKFIPESSFVTQTLVPNCARPSSCSQWSSCKLPNMVDEQIVTVAENGASVTATSAGEEVLRHFWDLASLDEAVRNQAAVALVDDLVKSQQAHDSNDKPSSAAPPVADGASKQAKVDAASKSCSPLVVYSLRRLVRGLGSGRHAARQGFALALTLLLHELPAVSVEAVLGLMDIWLQATNSMKGSDGRDAILGRVFGFSALVRSGRASKDAFHTQQVASGLVHLLQSKSFLREASASALLQLIQQVDRPQLPDLFRSVDGLTALLHSPAETATPEIFWLALQLWGRLPDDVAAGCSLLPKGVKAPPPEDFFTNTRPDAGNHPLEVAEAFFSGEHLRTVVEPLRLSSSSHPNLHSVWTTLLALLVPGFTPAKVDSADAVAKGKPGPGQLETFWNFVVEDGLFTSSHERKFLGFQLFTLILPFLGPDQIPAVFSPRFQQCLVNSLSYEDRHLHGAAKKAVERMSAFAEKAAEPALRVSLAVALQRQGGIGFDRLTRTKTVENLLRSLDSKGFALFFKHLKQTFAGDAAGPKPAVESTEEEDEDGEDAKAALGPNEASRSWVVEQLTSACSLPRMSSETRTAAAHYLTLHAFFELDASQVKGKELKAAAKVQPPPSEATRKLCAARLMTMIRAAGKVQRSPDAVGQPHGNAAHASESTGSPTVQKHERRGKNELLAEIVEFVSTTRDVQGVALVVELSEPIAAAVTALRKVEAKAAKSFSKLSSSDNPSRPKSDQLLSLVQLARWLQLYIIGDAENIEPELAEELSEVYKAAFGKASKKAKEGSEDNTWMDRLVDILLSLLAYSSAELPSVPLREAVEATFKAFAVHLTPTGLQDLVRIVCRSDGSARNQEAILGEDRDEDEEDDEEASEEEAEGDDDEESEEKEIAGALDGLAETERPLGMEIDNGQPSTSDQDDDEDEDMTDEQMFKMDKLLAAVLRTQKAAKSNAKNTKQAMENFKLRTLALLELYFKAAGSSPLIPGMLPDLVKAARIAGRPSSEKALSKRFGAVIRKLYSDNSKLDQASAAGIDADSLRAWIVRIHAIAAKAPKADDQLPATAAVAMHYLLRVALAAHTDEHKAAAASASKHILSHSFKHRGPHAQQSFVVDVVRRHIGVAEALLPGLIDLMCSARTAFLQGQAIELLLTILKLPTNIHTSLGRAVKTVLPTFAKSSATILAGEKFIGAGKHAEVLKNLAAAWEMVMKLLNDGAIAETLGPDGVKALGEACTSALETAATQKFEDAVLRIGKVIGVVVAKSNPDMPKREYQNTKANNKLPGTKLENGNKKPAKERIAASSKQRGKKRKSAEHEQDSLPVGSGAEEEAVKEAGGKAPVKKAAKGLKRVPKS